MVVLPRLPLALGLLLVLMALVAPMGCSSATQNHRPPPNPNVTCELAPIYFDFGQTEPAFSQQVALHQNAECLRRSGRTVQVIGHTDLRRTEAANLAIGRLRARAVRRWLVTYGVRTDQLRPVSAGNTRPACTEQTEACRARNQRVTIEPDD